jgi:hypothetical protein
MLEGTIEAFSSWNLHQTSTRGVELTFVSL